MVAVDTDAGTDLIKLGFAVTEMNMETDPPLCGLPESLDWTHSNMLPTAHTNSIAISVMGLVPHLVVE